MPEKKQVALPKYCESVYHSVRRPTRTINVRLPPLARCICHSYTAFFQESACEAPLQVTGCCLWAAHHAGSCSGCEQGALAAQIGPVQVGSEHPVRVQTMTTTGSRSSRPSLLHLCTFFPLR